MVAGATRGAGRGIARMLGAAGATVYCAGRSVGKVVGPPRDEVVEGVTPVAVVFAHGDRRRRMRVSIELHREGGARSAVLRRLALEVWRDNLNGDTDGPACHVGNHVFYNLVHTSSQPLRGEGGGGANRQQIAIYGKPHGALQPGLIAGTGDLKLQLPQGGRP